MIVGLTGGIGSGKSTVGNMFAGLGIPVYIADEAAKNIMNTSDKVRNQIISLFGEAAYSGKEPNRTYIAKIVFNNPKKLQELNRIIHPKVKKDFEKWVERQNAPYVIKEAAILFESGADKGCDYTITVTAPTEERIARVMKRDETTREAVIGRMNNQWGEEKRVALSDFVIENTSLHDTANQVNEIHEILIKKNTSL
ncbi:dephospho-CoA kinase [Leptobacterium sp. I13]|uniref:dephospho-CoA kinase n=1 Tax=Leptobacterium meishanense TaxID=3128904 RepID=UPI0030EB32C6